MLILSQIIHAQEYDKSEQTLEFYYIAHDRATPVGKVCDFIQDRYKEATYYKDLAMIFYLANGDNPLIVRMNMQGDNRKEFDNIINALQQHMSHEVSPNDDKRIITELFNDTDFLESNGELSYRTFQWVSFVTPIFWQMGYNEDILASLYFILEMNKLSADTFTMDIYYDNDGSFRYNSAKPFGDKKLCNRSNIMPLL